ncbi:hypothetical protein [Musicola keenii]|uniref:FMN-binding protein n=1 Tax=Musicola keenii TaxID=2884250 RepID=UPI001CE3119C|nr:hypothetical protein [Musicola keenii]
MTYERKKVGPQRYPVRSVLAGLLGLCVMGTAQAESIVPGDYTGSAQGKESSVSVTLGVDQSGKITHLSVNADGETPGLKSARRFWIGKA